MPHAHPTPSISSPGARASSPAPTFSCANPALYIANATTGSADVSSAAPSPHTPPATPSATISLNEPQTTNDKPQTTNNSPSPAPPSSSPRFDHRAPHFTLFLQILHIASTVIVAIAQRMDSDLHCLTLLQGCEAINCLYSIIRIQLTIDRHPERITPAELRRLAKASRYINRLARQKLDFSLFTTTQDNEQQATNNNPSPNPQSANPQSSLPRLNVSGLRSTPVCHSPGATLARTCQSLCRILKLLPDLQYDPSGTVPTLDLANPITPSLTLGARTPSSAATFQPTNTFTPSPITPPPGARASSPAIPLPPSNPAALSPTTPHSAFPIPHFISAPT